MLKAKVRCPSCDGVGKINTYYCCPMCKGNCYIIADVIEAEENKTSEVAQDE